MADRVLSCALALTLLSSLALAGCGDDDDLTGGAAGTSTTSTTDSGPSDDTEDGDAGADDPDEGSPEDEPSASDDAAYVDATVEIIVDTSDVEDDDARCIATALVDAAGGAEELSAAGLDPADWAEMSAPFDQQGLPSDDATVAALAEDLGGCDDGYELFLGSAAPDALEDVRTCVTDAVSEAEVRHQMALSIVRGGAAIADRELDIFRLLRQCEDESLPG